MLLYPSNNSIDTEYVEINPSNNDSKYRLINIYLNKNLNNYNTKLQNQYFSEPFLKENENSNDSFINVKSILFCMNYMNEPIDQQVRDKFSNLEPTQFLANWLEGLEELQEKLQMRTN